AGTEFQDGIVPCGEGGGYGKVPLRVDPAQEGLAGEDAAAQVGGARVVDVEAAGQRVLEPALEAPHRGDPQMNLIRPAAKAHILSSSQPWLQRWMLVSP